MEETAWFDTNVFQFNIEFPLLYKNRQSNLCHRTLLTVYGIAICKKQTIPKKTKN